MFSSFNLCLSLLSVATASFYPVALSFLRGYVRERSEKVHATIPRVIAGGFKFTVVQRNLK